MSISNDLGPEREITVGGGTLRYRERGTGPTLVFVHGLLANGDLWRKVVPALAETHRCIVPDWPLGAHQVAFASQTPLDVPTAAALIPKFLEALELEDVTLIANDSGGALTQIAMTTRPERIARVVLTSCDAFDNFLPPMFLPLQWLAHVPPLLTGVLQLLRVPALRRLPFMLGWLSKRKVDREFEDSYAMPIVTNPGVRRDTYAIVRDISPRYTNAAAERLHEFAGPVLLAWSEEDRFFPVAHAHALASRLPRAEVALIPDCYTFSSEDNPEALVACVKKFLSATTPSTED